jgi:hypothetical protein
MERPQQDVLDRRGGGGSHRAARGRGLIGNLPPWLIVRLTPNRSVRTAAIGSAAILRPERDPAGSDQAEEQPGK